MPGRAAVQLTRSILDSRAMVTGPPESAGMTTAVLGVKEPLDEGGVVNSIVQKTGVFACETSEMVAGPATLGAGGVVEPPESIEASKLMPRM